MNLLMSLLFQNYLADSKILKFSGLEAVPDDSELVHLLLDKICVVKLNGGLGTSMGCRGPKSTMILKSLKILQLLQPGVTF